MSPAAGAAVLRLATRGSALALAQADLAAAALRRANGTETAPLVVRTAGDRSPEAPLDVLEGTGWFTAALEQALLDGRADLAVHSAKDLPTTLAPGLRLAAVLERHDPRDALVSRGGEPLAALPDGARVGTSSARRAALLAQLRPELRAVPIRGNVDTRLRKLDSGEVDALLLACAGLDRLGLAGRISERLAVERFVPAPAQGAIALQVVAGSPAERLCAAASHSDTLAAVTCERALLEALGGGCLLPLGAWARVEQGSLVLTAQLVMGTEQRRVEGLRGELAEPRELAARAAERLR